MANKKIYVDLDLETNLIKNVGDPIDAQDVATKNYVDNNAGGGGGGGSILEWRRFNIPFLNNKAEATPILNMGLFPQGYYLVNINLRAIGQSVSGTLTELESVFFGSVSRVSYHSNEQVLNPQVYGVDNTGNRSLTVVFEVPGVSGGDVYFHTNYVDNTRNIIIGGGKVDVFRLVNPVTSWTP